MGAGYPYSLIHLWREAAIRAFDGEILIIAIHGDVTLSVA